MHTQIAIYVSLPQSVSEKCLSLFTFPPVGNWQRKKKGTSSSDTSSRDHNPRETKLVNLLGENLVNFFRDLDRGAGGPQFPFFKTLDAGNWRYCPLKCVCVCEIETAWGQRASLGQGVCVCACLRSFSVIHTSEVMYLLSPLHEMKCKMMKWSHRWKIMIRLIQMWKV